MARSPFEDELLALLTLLVVITKELGPEGRNAVKLYAQAQVIEREVPKGAKLVYMTFLDSIMRQ